MNNEFETLSNKEYLLTNGIGGYSASSLSGANTSKYHGLLVASFNPPTERLVIVSKLEETLIINNIAYELSANQYPGAIHPKGFKFIESFDANTDFAKWIYDVNGCRLQKTITMVQEQNTVIVTYKNLSENTFEIQLMPMLVYRDYHALFYEEERFNFYLEQLSDSYVKVFAEYGAHPIYIKSDKGILQTKQDWHKKIQYKRDQERGFVFEEDTRSIGTYFVSLASSESVQIVFSTNEIETKNLNKEVVKKAALPSTNNFIADLEKSSRQFVVNRKSTAGSTVIAGYHWFTDWGRDTMIALRGISIATGKKEEAKSILQTFFDVLSDGMLPNRFPDYDTDEVEYNTIDATLWLFIALYEYHQKFKDNTFIKKVLPKLKEIIDWHIKGTRFNIHLTKEGLLYGGELGYQLTWMDARIGDFVVTPRIGCPVEINALWYNALNIYNYFSKELNGNEDEQLKKLTAICKTSFENCFINEMGYLNDVVIPGSYIDDSIRPNQIYAISLPFSPLNIVQQNAVLSCIETHLLTPYGLRTLNIKDPNFKPLYEGDVWNRDNAYHQGTVWPFLWGEWAMAYLKLNKFSKKACKHILNHSKDLQNHFYNEGCVFAVAEIFDGLEPKVGKGCVQQAWSVANMLNVFLHKEWKL